MAVEPNLVQLGQGVYAFTHPDPRFGHSNVGLVIDQDGLTLIDTTATPAQAEVTANAGWLSQYYYRGLMQKTSSASAGLDVAASNFSAL